MSPLSKQDQSKTDPTPPILELRDASSRVKGETLIRVSGFSGTIRAGEMVAVPLDRHHDPRDLASTLQGLKPLAAGSVLFDGQSWSGNDYSRHFQMRSKIGRVFAGPAWIQNLTVRDNLYLPLLHHGIEAIGAESTISDWTKRLAGDQHDVVDRALGQRPSAVEPSILQICQLIRAVCNQPGLLILERPMRFLSEARQRALVSAVDRLRKTGTAVLYFGSRHDDMDAGFGPPIRQWQTVGSTLRSTGESKQ